MLLFKVRIKGGQKTVNINLNRFYTILERVCIKQNKEAIKVWLGETLKYIPGYTGTARGTLVPVGRTVGKIVSRFGPGGPSGNQKRAAQKTHIHERGRKIRAGFKYGKNYAAATLATKRTSSEVRNVFVFTNSLLYIARNDVNGPPPGFIMPSNPPWRSHDKGARAWRRYVLTVIPKKLPVPKDYIKITRLKVR